MKKCLSRRRLAVFNPNGDFTKISKSQIHVRFSLPGPCAIHLVLVLVLSPLFSSEPGCGEDKRNSAGMLPPQCWENSREPPQLSYVVLAIEPQPGACLGSHWQLNHICPVCFSMPSPVKPWVSALPKEIQKEIRHDPLFLISFSYDSADCKIII